MNKELNYPEAWENLANNFNRAGEGDASIFAVLTAANRNGQDEFYAIKAMLCADWTHPVTEYAELQNLMNQAKFTAPHIQGAGLFWLIQTECIGWPYPTSFPETSMEHVNHPVVLINAQDDPATPYANAQSIRRQITNSVLLTREGSGHGSYRNGGAINAVVESYFMSGILPIDRDYSN